MLKNKNRKKLHNEKRYDKSKIKTSLSDINQLPQIINDSQYDIKAVSFDIFDTLLGRCLESPEEVKKAVCYHLANYLNQDEYSQTDVKHWQMEQLYAMRQSAEKLLREQALSQGFDYECCFTELVDAWLKLIKIQSANQHLSTKTKSFIINKELELESSALFVKPYIEQTLQKMKKQGKIIIVISDMYLDSEYIKKLLADKGLLDYFSHIYVSADHLLGKHSGRLFELVIHNYQQHYALPKKSLLHIGDNPISDCRMAVASGIHGIWLYETSSRKRRQRQTLSSNMAKRGGIWRGRHFFECINERIISTPQIAAKSNSSVIVNKENSQGDGDRNRFFYNYGLNVLGPVFSVFNHRLVERLKQNNIEKVFFLARDGYIFHNLFKESKLNHTIEHSYLYISRRVIMAASVADGLTYEQAKIAFYNPKQTGLDSIFRIYGLHNLGLESLAKQHGFIDVRKAINDWHDERLISFLADQSVQNKIKQQGQQQKKLLEQYLVQEGFFSIKNVALVDIGWNGTIQKFLKKTFGQREDFPIVYGYYFAFVPKIHHDFGDNNYCEGLIHDARRGNACERIPAEVEEIFEQGARSTEATTMSYRWQDQTKNRIEPVLKSNQLPDRQAEINCNDWIIAIQKGVMDHHQHYQTMQTLIPCTANELLPYVYGLLERAVVYPTKKETQYLTQLVHTEDFGHDNILDMGRNAINWRDLLKPVQLFHRVKVTAWRYALFANIPTHFANFFFRVLFLYAVKK
ncbi:MAG: HAD family hydrolase [bacterium]